MGAEFFQKIVTGSKSVEVAFSFEELCLLLAHSLIVGVILCLITYFTNTHHLKNKKEKAGPKVKLILGTINILYLCLGLTCVMILVANNLARAFAVGAAIALVRFRIKLEDKAATSNFLFGIVAGIACGLDEVRIAYLATGTYSLINLFIYFMTKSIRNKAEVVKQERKDKKKSVSEGSNEP